MKCYTLICKNEGTTQVPEAVNPGLKHCEQCAKLIPLFEKACKNLGVELLDELFNMFREGVMNSKVGEQYLVYHQDGCYMMDKPEDKSSLRLIHVDAVAGDRITRFTDISWPAS